MTMDTFDAQVAAAREWFAMPRFAGIVRLHSPREVAEQQGTIRPDYTVAREAAEQFHARLRQLFAARRSPRSAPTRPGRPWP
jgi:isocitrate lyase